MDLAHEDVEMGSPLLLDRDDFIEEVHQHRLSPADRTPEVDAALRLRPAEQGLQTTASGGPGQIALQPQERGKTHGLRRIGPDLALGEALVVGGLQSGGHGPA